MNSFDYWRLCDELTVLQAALLIVGEDPAQWSSKVENSDIENRPIGYEAAKHAISSRLIRGVIEGKLTPLFDYDFNHNQYPIEGTIDISISTVDVESLREMLKSRGVSSGFFFPDDVKLPDYLDKSHSRYSNKLAAAIDAWQSVTDHKGTTPKKALEKHLREHAAEFGMTDDVSTATQN